MRNQCHLTNRSRVSFFANFNLLYQIIYGYLVEVISREDLKYGNMRSPGNILSSAKPWSCINFYKNKDEQCADRHVRGERRGPRHAGHRPRLGQYQKSHRQRPPAARLGRQLVCGESPHSTSRLSFPKLLLSDKTPNTPLTRKHRPPTILTTRDFHTENSSPTKSIQKRTIKILTSPASLSSSGTLTLIGCAATLCRPTLA